MFKLMKTGKLKYLLLLAILTWGGCEKELNMELPGQEPQLVVNGEFNPDSTWRLMISTSRPAQSRQYLPLINNATVEISEKQGWTETLQFRDDSFYISSHKPRPGKTYQVKVIAPGYEPVTAESTVPPNTSISIIDTGREEVNGTSYFKMGIEFKDKSTEDFYTIDGNIKAYQYIAELRNDTLKVVDSVLVFYTMELLSDNVLFKDLMGAGLEGEQRNLAYINGEEFTDQLFNGSKYRLDVFINPARLIPGGPPPVQRKRIVSLNIKLKTLSRDLFLYTRSYKAHKSTAFNPFAEPVRVYSNITGGYGIFAAYNQNVDSVEWH